MFAAAELIVGLWFFPVTLFIIIPLVIAVGWHVVVFANFLRGREGKGHDWQVRGE